MPSFFENLGRKAGRAIMKGKCLYDSLAGSEGEALEAEQLIGAELATAFLAQAQLDDDPAATGLVSGLGTRLAAKLVDKRRRFVFRIIRVDDPNAFALPGGFVFVTQSILTLCRMTPDEIGFILAHEMGHVVCRHAMERVMAGSVFSALARVAPPRHAAAAWLRRSGVALLSKAYSRDHELEADEFAVCLMRAAGLAPDHGAQLLARLTDARGRAGSSGIAEYFASHPPLAERIAQIRANTRTLP